MPFEVCVLIIFMNIHIEISKLLFFLIHRSTNMFTVVRDIDSDLADFLAYINDTFFGD